MGQFPAKFYRREVMKTFYQELSTYEMSDLRNIYEYYRSDFIYIVQSLDTKILLKEMASWNILEVEKYDRMRNDLDQFAFSEMMVQDILDQGREAIIALWECLCEMWDFYSCYNLSQLLYELKNSGDTLMQQIQLDKHGHPLSSELKDIQEHHRQHLLEYAQNVVDNKSSTSTREKHHGEHQMDMMVVYSRPYKRRSQHVLVESGVKHESYLHKNVQNMGKFISLDRLFRWSEEFKCSPHSVMITGAPRVGKTTLIKKFVCDWVNGKLYQRFSFVFFFTFQDLNRLGKVSLETMVLHLYPYLQNQLASIFQFPEKIIFVFDGLDESIHQMDFSSCQLCSNASEVENISVIVVSLVRQSLLKGCSVLMTSKTSRVTRKVTRAFMRTAEIMGFRPIHKEIYFQNFFNEKTLSDQVFSYVKDNGALYNFCYIPTFCWIVCEVLADHFKAQPNNPNFYLVPKTVTQLMTRFVSKILSNHTKDRSHVRKLLVSLGWMADYGLSNDILYFKEQVLTTFRVDATSELLQQFMVKTGHPPNVNFFFLHLLLPEFLAALVHYISYSPEKLYKSLENANSYKDRHDEMFLYFLCGLSDQSTRSILKPYLGKLSSRAITRAVKCVSAWLIQQSTTEVQKLGEFRYDKRRCLTVFYYLYETQNKDLVREVLGSCRRLTLSPLLLTPLDCTVLSFILELCEDTEELDLDSCIFHHDSLRRFAPFLYHFKEIRLGGVKMGNDGIQFICPALINPQSKIQSLLLHFNKLSDISCMYLAPAIRNNQSLKILHLSHNSLSGPHFSDLMDALSSPACRIEELYLDSAGLIETSCIQLASGIRNNRSLKILDLSRNYLSGPHLSELMEALASPACRIEELLLCEIFLQDEHAPLLASLSGNPNLTHLDLSHNSMTDASFCHIKDLVLNSSSLKKICLWVSREMTFEIQNSLSNLSIDKPGLMVYV